MKFISDKEINVLPDNYDQPTTVSVCSWENVSKTLNQLLRLVLFTSGVLPGADDLASGGDLRFVSDE